VLCVCGGVRTSLGGYQTVVFVRCNVSICPSFSGPFSPRYCGCRTHLRIVWPSGPLWPRLRRVGRELDEEVDNWSHNSARYTPCSAWSAACQRAAGWHIGMDLLPTLTVLDSSDRIPPPPNPPHPPARTLRTSGLKLDLGAGCCPRYL
jgi:hypothetical protein